MTANRTMLKTNAEAQAQRRLFFALWPPADVLPQISQCAEQAHQLYGGRIMRPDTLHLTLAFLGHTSAEKIQELIRQAPGWVISSGRITLNRVGRFRGPGVVWAGPEPDQPTWLYGVYDYLWDQLATLGWDKPETPFCPHVSLLRNAGQGPVMDCPPITWTSGEAVLVASTPKPDTSYYQVLARVPVTL